MWDAHETLMRPLAGHSPWVEGERDPQTCSASAAGSGLQLGQAS